MWPGLIFTLSGAAIFALGIFLLHDAVTHKPFTYDSSPTIHERGEQARAWKAKKVPHA